MSQLGTSLTMMPLDPEKWASRLCEVVGRDLTDAERHALPSGSSTDPVCVRRS